MDFNKFSNAKHVAKTPKRITPGVLEFCRELGGSEPVFVTIYRPVGKVGHCYANAEDERRAGGGRVVYGWTLWEHPSIYLTAEYHALVERDRVYVDTTPQPDGTRRLLFLPVPDADRPTRPVMNRFHALIGGELIGQLFRLKEDVIRMSYEGKAGSPAFHRIDAEATRILETLIRRQAAKCRR